nr:hypothetical protein GCM10020093_118220 [Planobispora longispora]
MVPDDIPMRGTVLSTHVPANGSTPLLVIRKTNSGRADALNVGINFARHPLVCMVDADSLLDPSALLLVAKPFADDPLNVVATGGWCGSSTTATSSAGGSRGCACRAAGWCASR